MRGRLTNSRETRSLARRSSDAVRHTGHAVFRPSPVDMLPALMVIALLGACALSACGPREGPTAEKKDAREGLKGEPSTRGAENRLPEDQDSSGVSAPQKEESKRCRFDLTSAVRLLGEVKNRKPSTSMAAAQFEDAFMDAFVPGGSATPEDSANGQHEGLKGAHRADGLIRKTRASKALLDQINYRLPEGFGSRIALERFLAEYPTGTNREKVGQLSREVEEAAAAAGTAELEELSVILAMDPVLDAAFGVYAKQLLMIERSWKRKKTPMDTLRFFEQILDVDVVSKLQRWEKDLIKRRKPTWLSQAAFAAEIGKKWDFEGETRSEQLRTTYEVAGAIMKATGAKTAIQQREHAREVAALLQRKAVKPFGAVSLAEAGNSTAQSGQTQAPGDVEGGSRDVNGQTGGTGAVTKSDDQPPGHPFDFLERRLPLEHAGKAVAILAANISRPCGSHCLDELDADALVRSASALDVFGQVVGSASTRAIVERILPLLPDTGTAPAEELWSELAGVVRKDAGDFAKQNGAYSDLLTFLIEAQTDDELLCRVHLLALLLDYERSEIAASHNKKRRDWIYVMDRTQVEQTMTDHYGVAGEKAKAFLAVIRSAQLESYQDFLAYFRAIRSATMDILDEFDRLDEKRQMDFLDSFVKYSPPKLVWKFKELLDRYRMMDSYFR